MIGAVLIIGGGVGGMVASLDLANIGYKVYLVESSPSIGGKMSQLDKTFPTLDCSMCTLAPRMVDLSRHPSIELLAYSEVESVKGKEGDFRVKVRNKARYIDDNCTGCGECSEVCPVEVPNEYEVGCGFRKIIYRPFPQAVPSIFTIDMDHCRKCYKCLDACKDIKAINFSQKDEIIEINVGAIIDTVGFSLFDVSKVEEYGYKIYPNVITGLELERLINASGFTGGEIYRADNREVPKKIAFIQCVGSRDIHNGVPYCSRVCCMYAIKQAILVKEHHPEIECTIFYIDIRAFGKGYEEFYDRAVEEYGIKFVRGRAAEIYKKGDNHIVRYEDTISGKAGEYECDMAILANAILPNNEKMAEILRLELDEYGFIKSKGLPMETERKGVYVAGVAQDVRDITDTVAMSCGAAALAAGDLASERGKLVKPKEFPLEKDVSSEEARIGVFVCHCGSNIAAVIDTKVLAEYAKTLKNVVYATDTMYACSEEGINNIRTAVVEHNLNRVIVAACTPRTHEPLFRETIQEVGLNPYLFEFANIREHCSWVHKDYPKEANEKAKDIIKSAVARATLLEPQKPEKMPVTQKAIVIGGGVAGMEASYQIARGGFEVHLIEKKEKLGGIFNEMYHLFPDLDPKEIVREKIDKINSNKKIKVHLNTRLEDLSGFVGNFDATLSDGSAISAGAVVLATGGNEWKPNIYGYGQPNVYTQLELQRLIAEDKISDKEKIVMIQCAGSREKYRRYCSRICCSEAIKNAIDIKKKWPHTEIYVLYRDIRTFSHQAEEMYLEAGKLGVLFIRFDLNERPEVKDDTVSINDTLLREKFTIKADKVILSAAIVPDDEYESLSKMLRIPLSSDGFFLEAHLKLRPLDFTSDGFFLCGTAQSPKDYVDTMCQAVGVASRVSILLSKEEIEAEGITSMVNEDLCIGCGICESVCPFMAIKVVEKDGRKKAEVTNVKCKGCGVCASSCTMRAITMRHFTDDQLIAEERAILEA
ncbi:MAG: CoB--CoM heterodisulfide reductase iron-sulfur subunit A [Candidatus Methanolliviera sp. GoM_asphalt]|nr:MAG: CoB--CoM heterodisulfide reductase iron-sulfur subunit A [Candidatus Methanolliviera sp. GoM_asphalt]